MDGDFQRRAVEHGYLFEELARNTVRRLGFNGRNEGCPFLTHHRDGTCSCAINETKPNMCRDFVPGSNKICQRWPDA